MVPCAKTGVCLARLGAEIAVSQLSTSVPITSFLNGDEFDRETARVMGVAFAMTRVALGFAEGSDRIVAKTIMELTKQGERNPDLLCERALA
jgi:hypothetical protein